VSYRAVVSKAFASLVDNVVQNGIFTFNDISIYSLFIKMLSLLYLYLKNDVSNIDRVHVKM